MVCKKVHSAIQTIMSAIPTVQGSRGEHKCSYRAYEEQGFTRKLSSTQRHKSPHAAYARGDFDGIQEFYKKTM